MGSEVLPPGWRIARLGELGEVNRGRSRHRPRYAEHLYGGRYPFIQTGDIKSSGGRITRHSQTYSEAGLAQSRLWPAGTLCITIAANIAETAILTYPACFPDSVVGFVAGESQCDIFFVEYVLRHLRRSIQHEATGSVQDNINLDTLGRLSFWLPPPYEQREIVSVLKPLDDKIFLNEEMNQNLEALARAIFKSWFVDFDPVREGNSWPSKPGLLGDLAALSKDSLNPADCPDEVFEYYSIPAFDESKSPRFEAGREIKSNKFIVPPGAVLLSKLNPRIPRIWMPRLGRKRRSICSTEFLPILPTQQDDDKYYLYSLFCSPGFLDELASKVTGTSGSHQRVRPDDLLRISCKVPEKTARRHYSEVVRPMFDRIALNLGESRTLAALRDALLPKLLSGEIRVKQAEKIVGKAV